MGFTDKAIARGNSRPTKRTPPSVQTLAFPSMPSPSRFHQLAKEHILIGLTSHALTGLATLPTKPSNKPSKGSGHVLDHYAALYPLIEFEVTLPDLPSDETLKALFRSTLEVRWRLSLERLEDERQFFDRPEWTAYIQQIQEYGLGRHGIVLALDRTTEYTEERLDTLITLVDALYPLSTTLEFEHSSWKKAESVLTRSKISRVELDAPRLPGIIKKINAEDRRASYLRLVGRNARTWFEHHPQDRFHHVYTDAELLAIADRIQELRTRSEIVYVTFSNFPVEAAMENSQRLVTAHLLSTV